MSFFKSYNNKLQMKSKIRNFQLQTRLGSGSYGVIFKAINKTDKSVCVLKQIRMNKMSQKTKKSTLNEATIMGKLVHPFIVQYQQSFIQDNTLHIVMQYCDNGDLSMFLKLQNKKPLKQQKIWKFFIQICMGLEFIHKNKILHRDVKTLNIFLNKNQDIKIGDLGVAKMLQANDFAQTMVGTPFYLSPQLCQQKPYNEKSDIWALGCLLYELCTYKHPFQAANQASLILKIIRGKYSPIPQFYSKELKDMIDLCLQRDYKRRPNATMILTRPKIKDMISQFKINQKIQDQFKKMKSNKQNKQPISSTIQVNKSKEKVPQKIVPVINTNNKIIEKVVAKDVVNVVKPSQLPQPLNQVKIAQDKSKYVPPENNVKIQPQVIQQKKIVLPQKKPIVVASNPSPSPSPLIANQKKQSKKQFLMNLQKRVVQKSTQRKSAQKIHNEDKIAQIEARIKQIQKIQKNKPVSIFSNNNVQKAENKQKQSSSQNKIVLNKGVPPLPTKPKQIVTKVKMEKPPIQPKVYGSTKSLQGKGIIKSGGFSKQINNQVNISFQRGSNQRYSHNRKKTQSQVKKPVLFGIDQEEMARQSIQNNKSSFKHQNNQEKGSKNQYSSQRNIKVAQISGSRLQIYKQQKSQKQAQRYLFKKDKDNQRASNSNYVPTTRVRKGSNAQMSRMAKNVSKYNISDVTKQEQAEVMNLPDKIHNNQNDSSDQEEKTTENQIFLNKKFNLKEVNNELILQKYQQIISNKEIQPQEQNTNKRQSIIKTSNISKSQNNRSIKINKNLNFYKQQSLNSIQSPSKISNQIHKNYSNKQKKQMKNSLFYEDEEAQQRQRTQQKQQQQQQEQQIQDQSEECIDFQQQNNDNQQQNYNNDQEIGEQIYEINKFNLRQYDDNNNLEKSNYSGIIDQSVNFKENQKHYESNDVQEQQGDDFWNQKLQKQQQKDSSVWSFDQEPQLPLLEQKEGPDFQQANPYLVQQEEETIQMKKNYLQIKLQQNMKREDQINKLMQIKIQECRTMVPKYFDQILIFFRKKINMDGDYTENDQKQIDDFLLKKGLTDQRKFQNVYKIMHFQMQLQNTRKIIQRLCKKLNELQDHQN